MDSSVLDSKHTSTTLIELLQMRAYTQPEQMVYTFLTGHDMQEQLVTFRELDRRARRIGAILQAFQQPQDRALLLYQPGLEYTTAFFGCLYAGVVAVPAYLPHSMRQDKVLTQRLQLIVRDARPTVALTTSADQSMIAALCAQIPGAHEIRILVTNTLAEDLEDDWKPPQITSDQLACLQYTSGSTAHPKGVMISHGNLLHNSSLIQHFFEHTEETIGMSWLPPYHDMGLMATLQPVYCGRPSIMMSPVSFLQRPLRWLQAISHYKVTTSGGPNFAYELCLRKVSPEQRATLDLSHWRVAFNGAESVRAKTLEQFAATFAECGFRKEAFYPCYGLAEATLMVSGGYINEPPVACSVERAALQNHHVVFVSPEHPQAQQLVGCGHVAPDEQVIIVDPERLVQCPENKVGEIWIRGASIAQGYWRQPDLSQQVFQARLSDTGQGPFFRTGDLGFLWQGELFLTGRLKDLIIINGRNFYPQDIELTIEHCHPALQPGCGAAFAFEQDDQERLVIVHEVERHALHIDPAPVIEAIQRAVVETYGLQVYAVQLIKTGSIPKTSSGKIQRHACRARFLDGTLEVLGNEAS